jgi:hypothetical protein
VVGYKTSEAHVLPKAKTLNPKLWFDVKNFLRSLAYRSELHGKCALDGMVDGEHSTGASSSDEEEDQ